MYSTTSTMQQLIENLAADLCKNFGEMHRQLINLDKRLHAIEQARTHGDVAITGVQDRLDREAAINDLTAETKRVMIVVGKSYLKHKMGEPQSSSAPEIIPPVSATLLWAVWQNRLIYKSTSTMTTTEAIAPSYLNPYKPGSLSSIMKDLK